MLKRTIIITGLLLLAWSCAQQASPSGGPRDEDPPRVLECDPPNYSTNFEGKRFAVTFDEYVVLENMNQELVVSPPMEEKPEVKLRKRTMIVEIQDTLIGNTTYTFNFGSSIKDLHEGNKLQNYEFVFSTGDVLDSLSIRGKLHYAHDLSVPEEPISILLYTDLRDSVPLLDIPRYVGRSNDSGVYSVNNLAAAEYKLFALKDGNNNFLFDLPTEEIAFLDSTIMLHPDSIRRILETAEDSTLVVPDSLAFSPDSSGFMANSAGYLADSTGFVADSATQLADSLMTGPDYTTLFVDLRLFIEELRQQYIMDNARDDRRLIELVFARPLGEDFSYRFLRPMLGTRVEVLEVFNPGRDSLKLWLLDSLDYKQDTLFLELNYEVLDSMEMPVNQLDTLRFTYRDRTTKKRRDGDKTPKKKELMELLTIRNSGEQDLHKQLKLDFDQPLDSINDSLFTFFSIPDSIELPQEFSFRRDEKLPTRLWLETAWESVTKYRMYILPGAFHSIYGSTHDTLDVSFRTRDIEYYGQIILNLEGVRHPVIIELNSGEKTVIRQRVDQDGSYNFPYLVPADYKFKFIHDVNDNDKWDTGDYLEGIQPEYVELPPKSVKVRSNWDHEVNVVLEH